jgi:hypothetical protein
MKRFDLMHQVNTRGTSSSPRPACPGCTRPRTRTSLCFRPRSIWSRSGSHRTSRIRWPSTA